MRFNPRLLLLSFTCAAILWPYSPFASQADTAITDESKRWQPYASVTGRLEAEHDRIQAQRSEINKIRNALEEIRTVQLYPTTLTNITPALSLEVEKKLKETELSIQSLERELGNTNAPLSDAIGILRQLINEDKEPQMLFLLERESRERALHIAKLRRKMNDLWEVAESILEKLMAASGITKIEEETGTGFDSEFFKVLYQNLGMTSDRFYSVLTAYRDSLVGRMDDVAMKTAASAEFKTAVKRFEQGNYEAASRDLLDIEKRYGRTMSMNGVFFYLGLTAQAMNRHKEAIAYFAQVAKNSPYYTRSFGATLQSLYNEDKYSRIDFMFEKFQNELSQEENLNPIFLTVAQAYYELGRDKAIIDLAARAKKGKPGYTGLLFVLGQSYVRQKDFSTAMALFRTVLENGAIDNIDKPFLKRTQLSIAHIDYEDKKYRQSLPAYISLLNDPEYFTEAMHGTAWSFMNIGQKEKAIIAFKKIINQSPHEPLGCEALLTLGKLNLLEAQQRLQQLKDAETDIKRIAKIRENLENRLRSGDIDQSRYKSATKRLEKTASSISSIDISSYEKVDSLYRRALESADLLIKVYSTGTFLPNPQKNMREDLLYRVHNLHEKSQSGMKSSQDKIARRIESIDNRRAKIIDLVIKARMFRATMLLERREWIPFYASQIERTIKDEHASINSNKSISLEEKRKMIAQRTRSLNSLINALERERNRSTRTMMDELARIHSHVLDDEQEAFVLYHKAEAEYSIAQEDYLRREAEYEKAMDEYRLKKSDQTKAGNAVPLAKPKAPSLNYTPSRALHEQLLLRHPESEYADASLYSLLFQHIEEGDRNKAVQYGEELTKKFPNSQYAPQTNLLLGEIYFDSSRLDKALSKYEAVLKFPGSRWFSTAVYKMGWTYYRLSDLKRAISAFFYLIKEQNESTDGGIDMDVIRKSLLTKEAIDYIAISFAESDSSIDGTDGLKKARQFVRKIDNKLIGSRIMHKLGNVYKDQFRYNEAIETFKMLKAEYPEYRDLPLVMNSVIECYEQKGQIPAANEGRRQLFLQYNKKSAWAQSVRDSSAIKTGDSLSEIALLDAASYTYSLALEKKSTNLYRQAVDYYWDYIKTYPEKEKAGDCHYTIAEILFGEGNYLEAAQQYMEVSKKYRGSRYKETAAMNAIVAAQQLLKQEEATRGQR